MSNYKKLYYMLDGYLPTEVSALHLYANYWFIKETKSIASKKNLYDTYERAMSEAFKVSKLQDTPELNDLVRAEIDKIAQSNKPHIKARATKIPYMWIIDD